MLLNSTVLTIISRLFFEVYTEEKFLFPVKFLIENCMLILKITVPISKNDDFIERLPLPVDADARKLARLKANG